MASHPPGDLRRAVSLVRPAAAAILVILIVSLVIAALGAIEPLWLKRVFDSLERGDGWAGIAPALAVLALLLAAREAAQAFCTWLTWRTRLRLHHRVLEAAVARLHALPLAYHQREGVGATMTRLDRGIQGFLGAFNEVAFNALPAAVYLGLSLWFMFALDARLALVVLLFVPLPPLLGHVAVPRQTRRERRLLDRWAALYSRFNEVLAGIATVKSFTQEEAEKRRFLGGVDEANREVERGVGFDAGIGAAQNLVVGAARLTALAAGGLLVARGEVTAGTLIAFLGYVAGLFGPVKGLASVYQTVHRAQVSLEALGTILDADESVADAPHARALERPRGEVRFERVRFTYPGGERELLGGVDLDVAAGERVAVVGPSGAGKSTLLSLLQRFYDPTAGRITVDGHDLRELTQASLRRHIGVVLQDAMLFNDSVRLNIAYGRPDACDRRICAAARHANAHEMIMRLPHGYETSVGERGSRLSAGERQRVAIARALLKDPPILILDEATSALDAESESLVQEALDRLTRGRTTFTIAHRLSTVVDADRIIVLQDGRITEEGDHAALMARSGYYAQLVGKQVGGLLAPA